MELVRTDNKEITRDPIICYKMGTTHRTKNIWIFQKKTLKAKTWTSINETVTVNKKNSQGEKKEEKPSTPCSKDPNFGLPIKAYNPKILLRIPKT
jgi:hypothetical protein